MAICQEQNNYPQLSISEEDKNGQIYRVISTNYLPAVKEGRVRPKRLTISKITEQGAVFGDGEEI